MTFKRRIPRELLYEKFSIDHETGCWNWTGSLFQGGYGYFKSRELSRYAMNASRASWIVHNGPIANAEIKVCHTCDNRKCVNPAHLFLGTNKDNMQDCREKGRINRGEDRPQSKLTEDQVIEIRQKREAGAKYHDLAREYGISKSGAFHVIHNNWKHVS